MRKLQAIERGYIGGRIVEIGEVIQWPHPNTPKWLVPAKAQAAVAVAAKQAEPIVVPADWEELSAADRKALASKISGQEVKRAPEADKIIDAYVEANKPPAEPFGDAPPPQTVGQAQAANGGIQPDWVAPSGDPKPVAD